MHNKKLFFFLFLFVALVAISTGVLFLQTKQNTEQMYFPIKTVAQKSLSKEKIKTEVFISLLDLREHENLKTFDLAKAEKKLKSFALLDEVKLKKIYPETLDIEYSLRTPFFLVQDCENMAVDTEGYLFPIQPYLTPKSLPKVFLGIQSIEAGKKVEAPSFILAKGLLSLLTEFTDLNIRKIDVSKAYIPQYGNREIRLSVEDRLFNGHKIFYFPFILRLSTNHFNIQLSNFLNLRKAMINDYQKQLKTAKVSHRFKERVIDLRIENLALIESQ